MIFKARLASRGFLSILCFTLACAPSGEASAQEKVPATLTVRGRVVDGDRRPIAGARVFAVHQPLYLDYVVQRTTTDEAGAFEIANVSMSERVRFFASAEGFAIGVVQQIFLNPLQTTPLEIVLKPVETLAFQVADPAGQPLAGATLGSIVWDGANGPAHLEPRVAELLGFRWPRSDASGKLELSLIPESTSVSGHIWHAKFARTPFKTNLASKSESSRVITLSEGIEFTLHVVGRGIAAPQEGWQLRMFRKEENSFLFTDEQITLDDQGQFRAVLPPGTYATILLRHPELQTLPGLLRDVKFDAGKPARVEISVTPRGNVTGRVVSAGSQKPLAGGDIGSLRLFCGASRG